jgi:NAD(P)H dehydrogenase (quinone)
VIPMFAGANVLDTGIFFPSGAGKVAFASRADLGEVAANILLSEGHENKVYTLTNTVSSSFADVAATLSELAGKEVPFISPDSATFEATLKQFGLPEPIIGMSLMFAAGIQNNEFASTDATLEGFLGRKQMDLKAFLKETYHL